MNTAWLLGGTEPKGEAIPRRKRKRRTGPTEHADDNGRVCLTGALTRLYETQDPHDRAHTCRDAGGLLLPAAEDGHLDPNVPSRARRYHVSQVVAVRVGRRTLVVGIDSAFDAAAARARRLEAAGIPVGWQGAIPSPRHEQALHEAAGRRSRVKRTRTEAALEREGTRILAAAEARCPAP